MFREPRGHTKFDGRDEYLLDAIFACKTIFYKQAQGHRDSGKAIYTYQSDSQVGIPDDFEDPDNFSGYNSIAK